MSRVARIVVPGYPHHVTQRGNRGADVFEDDDDRRFYLATLRTYAMKHGVRIWAYCLMTNHVHFIAVPAGKQALGRTFHDAHSVYSLRFNQRSGLSGHVFHGRFHSTALDEEHLWAAVRYVERNPLRAGMVGAAADYVWSSARAHCTGAVDSLLAADFPLAGVVDDWAAWLREEEDEASDALRVATRTGRPCSSMAFMKALEERLQRAVAPKKRGRKPRKRQQ